LMNILKYDKLLILFKMATFALQFEYANPAIPECILNTLYEKANISIFVLVV